MIIGYKKTSWSGKERIAIKIINRYGYSCIWLRMREWVDKDGYLRFWFNNRPKLKHRAIFEKHYNCCLPKWIVLHHKNGIKTDNRIENLEPMTPTMHTQIHKPGQSRYWLGKHLSEQTKTKLKEKAKLRISWNKGKKTGQFVWNKGKIGLQKHTKEWKKLASIRMKGNQYAKKRIGASEI